MSKKNEFMEVPGYGLKRKDLRQWWNNVAQKPDVEILEIDKLEDNLEFPSIQDKKLTYYIRQAIGGLEGCHFKVEHRINRITYAIKNNHFPQSNQKESSQLNKEWVRRWEIILDYLEKWSKLDSDTSANKQEFINGVKSDEVNELLGEKTILKKWQVKFVVDIIREYLELWFNEQYSSDKKWIQQKRIYEKIKKKYEKLNSRFWEKTSELTIPIKEKNHLITISELINTYENLVCISNPNFMNDLLSILGVIGGKAIYVHQACGFYLDSLKNFVDSYLTQLQRFLKKRNEEISEDNALMDLFGEVTPNKYWLIASLEKTIRFWI